MSMFIFIQLIKVNGINIIEYKINQIKLQVLYSSSLNKKGEMQKKERKNDQSGPWFADRADDICNKKRHVMEY